MENFRILGEKSPWQKRKKKYNPINSSHYVYIAALLHQPRAEHALHYTPQCKKEPVETHIYYFVGTFYLIFVDPKSIFILRINNSICIIGSAVANRKNEKKKLLIWYLYREYKYGDTKWSWWLEISLLLVSSLWQSLQNIMMEW